VEIAVPASTLYDPRASDQRGDDVADAAGTKTRDAKTIAETLAGLGASITFNVGDRYAYARFSTLTENLDAVLELTSDMLFNSTFPEDELAKWKNQQLSVIQQARAQPEFLATERFAQAMYPEDRPLVRPADGRWGRPHHPCDGARPVRAHLSSGARPGDRARRRHRARHRSQAGKADGVVERQGVDPA
jgi:hypothetical protein